MTTPDMSTLLRRAVAAVIYAPEVHPPEAFRPDSPIGEALAAQRAAQAAYDTAEAELRTAEADAQQLRDLVSGATLRSDMRAIGEARTRLGVLEPTLARARADLADLLRSLERARELFNNTYGAYSGTVRYAPQLAELHPVFHLRVGDWMTYVQSNQEAIARYEADLLPADLKKARAA